MTNLVSYKNILKMARFSKREKEIILKIASSDTTERHSFGDELCDVIFNTSDLGIFISHVTPQAYHSEYICQ